MKIWHNGTLKNEGTAIFTATDRIRLGDGVFDTMLVVDSTPQDMDLHLGRLHHDASILGIQIESDLPRAIAELIKTNTVTMGRYALNTIISRGEAQRGLTIPDNAIPNIVMRISPVPESFPPVRAIIAQNIRRNEGSPLSRIKSFNYGDNILAMKEAQEAGANEAIMLNNQGHVTCATAGNIIIEKDGERYTPPLSDGVLAGITRGKMIANGTVEEKSLSTSDLRAADTVFVINSIRGMQEISLL